MGCNTSKDTVTKGGESEERGGDKGRENEKGKGDDGASTDSNKLNGLIISQEDQSDNSQLKSAEEAATKIQAVFRGHKTRKSMKQPQNQPNENKEPTREELENEFRLDDAELCHAATKIQASFRGHMSRKTQEADGGKKGENSKENKEEELDIDLTDPDLNKAASKIQASFRGHMMTRKEDCSGATSSN